MTYLAHEQSQLVGEFVVELVFSTGHFMSAADAADTLQTTVEALSLWHLLGKGPRHYEMFGRCFYDAKDVETYAEGYDHPATEVRLIS